MEDKLHAPLPIHPFHPPPQETTPSPPDLLTIPTSLVEALTPYIPSPRSTYLLEQPLSNPHNTSSPSQSTQTEPQLPHVTLTYASSLDSSISLSPGIRTTLSGPATKAMTHFLRAQHDTILIGVGTAEADDPGLNCRFSYNGKEGVGLGRQPRPVVLDPSARWSIEEEDDGMGGKRGKVWELARKGEGRAVWWVVCQSASPENETEKIERERKEIIISRAGGGVIKAGIWKGTSSGVDWKTILLTLAKTGVRSVMVEGGATVINDLLRKRNQKYVSSVIVTIAPTYLGRGGVVVCPERGEEGRNEAGLEGVRWVQCEEDVVMAGFLKGD